MPIDPKIISSIAKKLTQRGVSHVRDFMERPHILNREKVRDRVLPVLTTEPDDALRAAWKQYRDPNSSVDEYMKTLRDNIDDIKERGEKREGELSNAEQDLSTAMQHEDAKRLYLGYAPKYGTMEPSPYRPTIGTSINPYQVNPTLQDDFFENALLPAYTEWKNQDQYTNVDELYRNVIDNGKTALVKDVPYLNNATISEGHDDKGHYISLYDKWDYNTGVLGKSGDNIGWIVGGKPVEIYQRYYLDDWMDVPKKSRGNHFLAPAVITEYTNSGEEFPEEEFKSGGRIHIKPENRGKFTALKKRTGHSASWFKAHGTPAQKKMAVFALNARKWKHGDGGFLLNTFEEGNKMYRWGADDTVFQIPVQETARVDIPYAVESLMPVVQVANSKPEQIIVRDSLLRQDAPIYGETIQSAVDSPAQPPVLLRNTGEPMIWDLNKKPVVIPERNQDVYFHDKAENLLKDINRFDPKGKTRDEIRAVQQEMANAGYYSDALNGMSKQDVEALQRKLISKGYLNNRRRDDGTYVEADGIVGGKTREAWNRYNVDGIWGKQSEAAYKRKVNVNSNDDKWAADFREGVDGCARWVTQKYESVMGNTSSQNGVIGNAWQMPLNIGKAGGDVIFNLYSRGFEDVSTPQQLKERTKARLKEDHADLSMLKPGDVVGVFFPLSTHHGDVLKEGTTYNTHVGIISGYDKDGTPIVQHNIGGKERKDRADKLPYGSEITTVSRPRGGSQLSAYPFQKGESNLEVELPEKFEKLATPEKKENLKAFMDSMAGGADVIGNIYNKADMDAVQKIAVAVLGRETGFMQNTESSRTGKAGHMVKAEKLLRTIIGDNDKEAKSSDLTKFKLNTLKPDERVFLGINSAEDLENPEKAGLASMYVLAKNYDYFKRYADQNPQLGLTKQDIEDLTALSYNQGMSRLYTVGSADFGGTRYPSQSKLDAIREAAQSDETLYDFGASKPGRIAKEFPATTNLMKFLYQNEIWGASGTSYMNAARRALEAVKSRRQN